MYRDQGSLEIARAYEKNIVRCSLTPYISVSIPNVKVKIFSFNISILSKGEVKRHFRPELDIFSERHDVVMDLLLLLIYKSFYKNLFFHLIIQVQSQNINNN